MHPERAELWSHYIYETLDIAIRLDLTPSYQIQSEYRIQIYCISLESLQLRHHHSKRNGPGYVGPRPNPIGPVATGHGSKHIIISFPNNPHLKDWVIQTIKHGFRYPGPVQVEIRTISIKKKRFSAFLS